MNGRERLRETFKGGRADRIPISPFIYSNNIYEMFDYKPSIDSYMSPPDFDVAEKFVAYHDFFGFDVLFTLGLLWDSYVPPAQFIDCNLIRRARQAVGDKGLVNVATHGAFNTLNQFRKLEDMMTDPLSDEGFYRAIMEFLLDWNSKHLREVARAGSDSIEIGANLATSGVGPAFFQRYVMQYENRLAHEIHAVGAFVVYHNCGDAQNIMHLYNDLEIDVWGYLTGPPFGDVILDDALRTLRPNLALRGNIDQVEFLRTPSPAEAKRRVRELIERVKPRGNWILCTSDFPFDGQP